MFQSVSLASVAAHSVADIWPVTSIGFVSGLDVNTSSSRREALSEVIILVERRLELARIDEDMAWGWPDRT